MKKTILLTIFLALFSGNICSKAQVGIGTSSPAATLDIKSKDNTAATKALEINNSSSAELVTVTNNGQVGINAPVPETDALLELKSTNKALLITRVANTAAIANPVNGMVIYDTSKKCFVSYENNTWTDCWSAAPSGSIASINCAGATFNGTLTSGTAASGVSASISYTGGDGGTHSGQTVTSTGITGLTATLNAGNFATGAGTLTYNITGTPSAAGTANFAINIGGQNCTLNVSVNLLPPGPITFANCSTAFNGKSLTSQAEYNNGARVIEIVNIGGTTTWNNNLNDAATGSWTPQSVLYSESNYNDVCTSTKSNVNSAATWTNSARNSDVNLSGSGGLVIDLQSFKDVDFVAVYNTPSDGKISHFKIDYSTSTTAPSFSNEAAWTNIVPVTPVNDIQPTSNPAVYGCSLTYTMSNRINARYWRVRVWNTGLNGPTGNGYIEVRQVKLMKFN